MSARPVAGRLGLHQRRRMPSALRVERYSRRLAAYYNDYYRNEAACPSIFVSGGSNFPVRKKEKQNSRRETLMREYNEIQGILSVQGKRGAVAFCKDAGTGQPFAVLFRDAGAAVQGFVLAVVGVGLLFGFVEGLGALQALHQHFAGVGAPP